MSVSLAIIGGRKFTNKELLFEKVAEFCKTHTVSKIISGGARGADTLGEMFAVEHKIPFVKHAPEQWGTEFLFKRNDKIAQDADVIFAFPDKDSRGTWNTIALARKYGKQVQIFS